MSSYVQKKLVKFFSPSVHVDNFPHDNSLKLVYDFLGNFLNIFKLCLET